MMSKIFFIAQQNNFKLLTSLVIIILCFITPAAKADYVPPSDQKPPSDYTKSTGIRGGKEIPFTLLAPQSYVGYNASNHPTFVWYVPNIIKNRPCEDPIINPEIEFSLYEYDINGTPKKRGKPVFLSPNPGIMKLTWTEEQPKLLVGKTYLWQIAMICKSQDENENEIYLAAADLEVVEVSDNLLNEIAKTENPLEKAEIYGQAGLWYDALEQILLSNQNSKLGELGAKFIENLADSEELKELEKLRPDYIKRITEKITNLREIAKQEK